MPYNSFLYLFVLLGSSVVLYYLMPLKQRWIILLLASLAFYLLGGKWLIVFPMLSTALIYAGGLKIDQNKEHFKEVKGNLEKSERKALKKETDRKNRKVLMLIVLLNLMLLIGLKYIGFIEENINSLISFAGGQALPEIKVLMPLGVSFYTLSAISYIVDVSQGSIRAERNYFRLLLHLIFFVSIVEGPFPRYETVGVQLKEEHPFDYQEFTMGLQLILWGLMKKLLVADRLDVFVASIFNKHESHGGLVVIITILIYTLQLYADFTGCIDIAAGSAQLFGIHLDKNFAQPFFSVTVSEFWRRWHMTLGSWFRDYVFYPVSLSHPIQTISRKTRESLNPYYASIVPSLVALLMVWLGTGIWHGAEWKYVFYGLYYYVIMAIGMLIQPAADVLLSKCHLTREHKGYKAFQMIRTFILVNIGMLIFRASDIKTAFSMLLSSVRAGNESVMGAFFDAGQGKFEVLFIVLMAALLLSVDLANEKGIIIREKLSEIPLVFRWAVLLFGVAFVCVFGAYGPGFGVVDFIYAQF